MHSVVRSLLAPALCAVLLAACGGGISLGFGDGDDDFGELDPYPSGRSATLTVSDAGPSPLDGTYSSGNLMLGDVLLFFATSRDPETCRFRFDELLQSPPGGARMEGEIRYLPGTSTLRTTFIYIDGAEYRLEGSAGASVDRDAGRVRYAGAVLQARGSLQQLTLDGTVPMRGSRPSGC